MLDKHHTWSTDAQHLAVIELVRDQGATIKDAAAKVGVSTSTAWRIVHRWRKARGLPVEDRSQTMRAKQAFAKRAGVRVGGESVLHHLSREMVERLARECERHGYETLVEAVADLATEQLMQEADQ